MNMIMLKVASSSSMSAAKAPPLLTEAGVRSSQLIRRDGRPSDVVAFEELVVSFFLSAADMFGVPKSVAAIYGVCFASAEPIGYSEIAARLDISAGSISQGLRMLREVGALKIVESESTRRDYFTPDLEMRKLGMHFLERRLQPQLDSGRGTLLALRRRIPAQSGSTKVVRMRLKSLQTWHERTCALIPLIQAFLKFT